MKLNLRNTALVGALFIACLSFLPGCGGDDEPETMAVTYSDDIVPILNNNCLVCHGGVAPVSYLLLEDYASVKTSGESGLLISRINDADNPMPPSGLMTEANRQTVQDWIDGGYAE